MSRQPPLPGLTLADLEKHKGSDWPFDAEKRDDRIPIIPKIFPAWNYFVAVCVDESGKTAGRLASGLRPTLAELDRIADYIYFKLSEQVQADRSKLRQICPFDLQGHSGVTVVLLKRGEGDWCYRRSNWGVSKALWPTWGSDQQYDLPALIDHIETCGGSNYHRWAAWKQRPVPA